MNIMQSMTEYSDKPQAEQETDYQAMLVAMKADQERHDAKYGKSFGVRKDRFVNSNFGMGL